MENEIVSEVENKVKSMLTSFHGEITNKLANQINEINKMLDAHWERCKNGIENLQSAHVKHIESRKRIDIATHIISGMVVNAWDQHFNDDLAQIAYSLADSLIKLEKK